MKKCYIVGAGSNYGLNFKPEEDDFVIAVDAGFLYLQEANLKCDFIIGDFDSLGYVPKGENVLELNVMKDDTDMFAAIKLGLEKGYEDFRLYCGTGGETAHTIANIQLLNYLCENGKTAYLYGDNEVFQVIQNSELRFSEDCAGRISIFALSNKAEGVTLEGLKYLLNDYQILNNYPIGVSNEFIGKEAIVSVKEGTLLIVYSSAKKEEIEE